jgi:hypothetical protein
VRRELGRAFDVSIPTGTALRDAHPGAVYHREGFRRLDTDWNCLSELYPALLAKS